MDGACICQVGSMLCIKLFQIGKMLEVIGIQIACLQSVVGLYIIGILPDFQIISLCLHGFLGSL